MLNLIIVQAQLELIPRKICGHASIKKMAERKGKKPTELLLDSNFHHSAMRGLFESERRGRPDLVHHVLITSMDSPLNREGLLRVHIHTRNNRLISVDPSIKVPQSYNRFVGLLEQVFKDKKAPLEGKALLEMKKLKFNDLIERIKPDFIGLLSEKGEKQTPEGFGALLAKYKNPVVLIGGFPHGDFTNEVESCAEKKVCIDPDLLKAWTVTSRVIMGYEMAIRLAEKRLGL